MDTEGLRPELTVVDAEPEEPEVPMIEVAVQIDDVTITTGQFAAIPGMVGVIRFDSAKLRAQLERVSPRKPKPKISVYRDLPAGLDREI